MTCETCRQSQRDGFEDYDNCKGIDTVTECRRKTDRVPKLAPGNRWLVEEFWPLLCQGLFDGFGGIRFGAVDYLFSTYSHAIPAGCRPVIHDKVAVMVAAVNENRKQPER